MKNKRGIVRLLLRAAVLALVLLVGHAAGLWKAENVKLGLDLSLEALVLEPAYGGLFSDEEANFALESLLDGGYYKLG